MTDLDDLIARLRGEFPTSQGFSGYYPDVKAAVAKMHEAAAALEAMRAENADLIHDLGRAQSALSEFATENERLRMEAHMAKSAVRKLEAIIAKHSPPAIGTRFPVRGPCWQDLERRVPATVTGQTVAVAENALFVKGEWLTAVQEVPARRPILDVMPNGEMELFFAKPDAGYSLATILTSGIMTFHVTPR